MCGIIGYAGNKKANDILVDGLLALEYRGYDSAGIATLENNEIKIMKDKGRVKNILDLDGYNNLQGTYGIAHTRWATHGKPSKENSHPHFDNSKTFAVVHNGIIENYNELRSFLTEKGYTFYSQTDTEVIPNLIHYYFSNSINASSTENNGNLIGTQNANNKNALHFQNENRLQTQNIEVTQISENNNEHVARH